MVVRSHPFAERLRTSSNARSRSDGPPGQTGRATRFVLAGIVAGVLAVAGCASGTTPGGPGSTATPAKVALKFTLTPNPGKPAKHWTLTCGPAGGTHPDPAAACSGLLRMKNPFAPRSQQIACPMILRSNSRIVVTGTWFGTTVHRVVLDGGCDMGLFSALNKMLR